MSVIRLLMCASPSVLRGMGVLGVALGLGCSPQPPEPTLQYRTVPRDTGQQVVRFAVHPLHNPYKLSQAYQPLMDHLNGHIEGVRFELEASRDYPAFEQKISTRQAHFVLPNPWQTLQAIPKGYRVIAMAGNPDDFKGLFIVRRDSGIHKPQDLRGKIVSYPSPTALAAAVMPQDFLVQSGLDIHRDIQNVYVGSQESSIMNVFLGTATAGATWPPPWRAFQRDHPTEAAALMPIWETAPLINNSVMARDDVPPALQQQVLRLLLDLTNSESGRNILARMETARFLASDNQAYDVVRSYVERFERKVRKVQEP